LGIRPENFEFWNPDIPLHVHFGRRLKTDPWRGFFVSKPPFG
jgi:hypothetical protein